MQPFLVVLTLLLAPLSAADPGLIGNGQTRAEIIIAEKAPRMMAFAAKELQERLKANTGAERSGVMTPPFSP